MRYRVYYQQDGSCTDEDFCICYANSETEAAEVFHKYHPDGVVDHVERRTGLYDMSKEGDLREFTDRLIEAICDRDEEDLYVNLMYRQGYGRD